MTNNPWKIISITLAILIILCIAAFTIGTINNIESQLNESYMDGFIEGWNMHGNEIAKTAYENGLIEIRVYEDEPVRSLLSPAGCVAAIQAEGCVIECAGPG